MADPRILHRRGSRRLAAPAAALLALALSTGGCGDDGQTNETSGEPETSVPQPSSPLEGSVTGGASGYDEAEILEHIGAEGRQVALDDGTQCEISDVLTSPSEVEQHPDGGGALVTDPDRSVGLVLPGSAADACQAALTEELRSFGAQD